MRTLLFGATLVTAFLLPVGQAAAQCCGGGAAPAMDHAAHAAPAAPAAPAAAAPKACCASHAMAAPAAPMACCSHGGAMALPADDPAVAMAGLGLVNPLPVKYIDVVFRDPVRVANTVLMGRYVIEHDDERMARGEPCTYVYEADDLRAPVVTFHCEHLERPAAGTATILLGPSINPSIKTLKEFQFGGETASHGVPVR
jgi:hypothetical protein